MGEDVEDTKETCFISQFYLRTESPYIPMLCCLHIIRKSVGRYYYINFDVEDTLIGKLYVESFKFYHIQLFPNTFSVVASCPFLRDYLRLIIIYKTILWHYFQGESLSNMNEDGGQAGELR